MEGFYAFVKMNFQNFKQRLITHKVHNIRQEYTINPNSREYKLIQKEYR